MKFIKNILKTQKGGIPTIITIVATTIVAMGLFSYTILNQSSKVKETGDKALAEQSKINLMLENPNYVTGKTVNKYIEQIGESNCFIYGSDGNSVIEPENVLEASLFEMDQLYNEDGRIETINFCRVDLSNQ